MYTKTARVMVVTRGAGWFVELEKMYIGDADQIMIWMRGNRHREE